MTTTRTRSVRPGDLRRGDVVVFPDGSRAEVDSIAYGLHLVVRFVPGSGVVQYVTAAGERLRREVSA